MNPILIGIVIFLLILEIVFLVFYFRHRSKDKKEVDDLNALMSVHNENQDLTDDEYKNILLSLHTDMSKNKKISKKNLNKIGVLQDVVTDNRQMIDVNQETIQSEKDIAYKNYFENKSNINVLDERVDRNDLLISDNEDDIRRNHMLGIKNEDDIRRNHMLGIKNENSINNNYRYIVENEDSILTNEDLLGVHDGRINGNVSRIKQLRGDVDELNEEFKKVKEQLLAGAYKVDISDIQEKTISLIDLEEFKKLDPKVKKKFKKIINDTLMPMLIYFLNEYKISEYLENHALDIAIIFQKIIKNNIDTNYEIFLNDFKLEKLTISEVLKEHSDYILGVFVPAMLDRLYTETTGLNKLIDKHSKLVSDVIQFQKDSDRGFSPAKILTLEVNLYTKYDFETKKTKKMNFYKKEELDAVFSPLQQKQIFDGYIRLLYDNVSNTGGFKREPEPEPEQEQEPEPEPEPEPEQEQEQEPKPKPKPKPKPEQEQEYNIASVTQSSEELFKWPKNTDAERYGFGVHHGAYSNSPSDNIHKLNQVHGDLVAYTTGSAMISVYDLKKQKNISTINLQHPKNVNILHLAFNGSLVSITTQGSGYRTFMLYIYDIDTQKLVATIRIPSSSKTLTWHSLSIYFTHMSENWIGIVHDSTIYIHHLTLVSEVNEMKDFAHSININENNNGPDRKAFTMNRELFAFDSVNNDTFAIPITPDKTTTNISLLVYEFSVDSWKLKQEIGKDEFQLDWKFPQNIRFHNKNIILSGYYHGHRNGRMHSIKGFNYPGIRGAVEVLQHDGNNFKSTGYHFDKKKESNDTQNGIFASVSDDYIVSLSRASNDTTDSKSNGMGEIHVFTINKQTKKWNMSEPYFTYYHSDLIHSYPHIISNGSIVFHDHVGGYYRINPIKSSTKMISANNSLN